MRIKANGNKGGRSNGKAKVTRPSGVGRQANGGKPVAKPKTSSQILREMYDKMIGQSWELLTFTKLKDGSVWAILEEGGAYIGAPRRRALLCKVADGAILVQHLEDDGRVVRLEKGDTGRLVAVDRSIHITNDDAMALRARNRTKDKAVWAAAAPAAARVKEALDLTMAVK